MGRTQDKGFSITSKIDSITGIPPNMLSDYLPAPKSVKIEFTGRCNYSCSFCARRKGLRQYADMDLDLFTRLLWDMRQAGVEEIGLFYLGEPFTDKRIPTAVSIAKNIGFPYIFLTTNGSLAKYNAVKKCIENGLNSLKFSFNYYNKQQFEEITGTKSKNYDSMLRNALDARRARDEVYEETGRWCGLFASYIEFDGEQGKLIKDLVSKYEDVFDEVYALPLYTMGARCTEDDEALGWKPTPGNRGRALNLREPLPCWSAFTEGHITCEGKLNICCFDQPDLIAADLKEVSFMEGWNSKFFQDIRSAHLRKDVSGTPCEQCVLVEQWNP